MSTGSSPSGGSAGSPSINAANDKKSRAVLPNSAQKHKKLCDEATVYLKYEDGEDNGATVLIQFLHVQPRSSDACGYAIRVFG